MAILGFEGYVELVRDHPEPIKLNSLMLERSGAEWTADIDSTQWWPGDKVRLYHPEGLPLEIGSTPGPATNNGLGMYGPEPPGRGQLTLHRVSDAAPMYQDSDPSDDLNPFYDDQEVVESWTGWIYRDALGRISFYSSEMGGINGGTVDRIKLHSVTFEDVLMEAVWTDEEGWRQQCDLTAWTFETDPQNLDITAIGEDFGSYARSLVRGAGSFVAHMDNRNLDPAVCRPSSRMAKLSLLTRNGGTAKARFMLTRGNRTSCGNDPPLWYKATILMGRTQLSVGLDEADRLSADFVATGPIELVASE